MKKIPRIIILVLAFLWQHCTDEQAPAKPGTLRFALRPTVGSSQGRVSASLPAGASLYVSVREVGGDDIYTIEPVPLIMLGDEYISEPLVLPDGTYALTDFLVVDTAGVAVYAAPKEGSEMARWVDDPLPQTFAVIGNAITQVSVQVLPTDEYQPDQFGYATFAVDVVELPSFDISAFRIDSTGPVFSGALAYLLSERDYTDTLYKRHLQPGVNTIRFAGEPDERYVLVLQEPGLATYQEIFVLERLLNELHGEPLQIILPQALTMSVFDVRRFFNFSISTRSNETPPQGPFTVNWGDGSYSVLDPVDQDTFHTFQNDNQRPGRYHVSLSGDLAVVRDLSFSGTLASFDDVLMRALPGLQRFWMVRTTGADTIDISHNTQLELVNISDTDVRYLDISHNPRINNLDLSDNPDFPVPVLDKIIADLYDHALEHQIYGGQIHLRRTPQGGIIGPPSPAAREKLLYLANTMGWTVEPSEF
jgi:hypothetical protein